MPASVTADGSSSPVSGPAACQNRVSITSAGISSRHSVTTFEVGMCHSRANGTSASSPATWARASQYEAPGIRTIASISRMTSGYDMIRRRSRFLSRPASSAAPAMASITPSPRWRSSSPSRAKSGSHPPASTDPSRRITAGAVTTGRQNTASSPDRGPQSPAVTVPRPRNSRSAARTTTVPVGVPDAGDPSGPIASTTEDRQDCTQGSRKRARTRHPYPYQEPYLMPKTAPKPQLTAVTVLNPWCCATARRGRPCAKAGPHRFRRHHPKWHDDLRGEKRKWDRLARSTPR
jgi:hypothetical protein